MLLFLGAAWAQTYAFPTTSLDVGSFYPTAYRDHGGLDWDCGDTTYAGHQGSDFGVGGFPGMDAGREVVAAASGTVVASHDGEFDRCTTGDCAGGYGFGNHVYIEHASGETSIYAHMKQFSVQVSVGDVVTCGQKLGEVGSSGYSTGPHLHFEVRDPGGVAYEPFQGACGAAASSWTGQGVHGGVPDLTCGDPEPCAPVAALGCGDVLTARNDDPGSTQHAWAYGCSEFVYSGPEIAWTFSTALDEPVTLRATGLSADLDLHVLASEVCDGTGCLAASTNPDLSDESLTFDAAAGVSYVVLLDGWEGAVSSFQLEVDCVGAAPEPTGHTGLTTPQDTGTTGTTAPRETGARDTASLTEPSELLLSEPRRQSGCACAAGPGGLGGLGWLLLPLGISRGRRSA